MKPPSPWFIAPCDLLSSQYWKPEDVQSDCSCRSPYLSYFLASLLPILSFICPLIGFLNAQKKRDELTGSLPGKMLIQSMHVWDKYTRKQLDYEWSLNHQIIGSSCPIRNEPSLSETLKYSEHLCSLQYEHHLHNDVSGVQVVVLLCYNLCFLVKELLSVFLSCMRNFSSINNKCWYLSSFGITDWVDQKVFIENVFLFPPPVQSSQDSWGLCFPRHAVSLLVEMMVYCWSNSHVTSGDANWSSVIWYIEDNNKGNRLIKSLLQKHSTFLEHSCFGGRKGQLVQEIEAKCLIQKGVNI